MSLTAINSPESTRTKLCVNSTYIMSLRGIKRFWAPEAEMSLTAISSPESARRKFFNELDVHHV